MLQSKQNPAVSGGVLLNLLYGIGGCYQAAYPLRSAGSIKTASLANDSL
jgi:hypothetical protein